MRRSVYPFLLTMTKKRLEKVKKAKGEMRGENNEEANNNEPAADSGGVLDSQDHLDL